MNKLITLIAGAIGVAALITSCDNVSEPDRFIPAEIVAQRAILIEEFTGQRCTNCPDGHVAIKEITSALGDSVVAVGIHASNLGINFPNGLKTTTGEEYYKAVGSPALPTAVINMQTSPLQVAEWGAAIDRLIMTPTPFTVKADTKIDGDNFNISVALCSGQDYSGRLMVWVCENDIVKLQIDHGVTITDYVHNHVFRAAATSDIWGKAVSLKAHEAQYLDFSCPIDSRWNKDEIYAVAFLYNNAGVAQVTSTH